MTPMNKSVQIRRMTGTDIERVVEIAAGLKQGPQWSRDAYLTALDPATMPTRIAVAAEETANGEIVGFAIASLTAPEAELETIAVATSAQRKGIARHIFGKIAEMLQQAGASTIALEVRASNVFARALYESLGFMEVGRRPRYYVDPVEDAVLMVLRFN